MKLFHKVERVVGLGLDDVEDLGGALEAVELPVEVGALREEAVEVEVEIELALVRDALVEEPRHGSDVGEGSDVMQGLLGAEFDGG